MPTALPFAADPPNWLPHALVVPDGPPRPNVAVLLHGILGSARNVRGLAVALARAAPQWSVLAVDLRHHGASANPPPPDTVDGCCADIARLCSHLGLRPRAVIGHSFGGKVALRMLARPLPTLRYAAMLDTLPHLQAQDDADDQGVAHVIAAVQRIAMPQPDRQSALLALRGQGLSDPLCQWMATNLTATPDGMRWQFNLNGIAAMLQDYFAMDCWPVLREPPPEVAIDLVRGGRSPRWTPEILRQCATLPANVRLTTLPNAGHWLHVDDLAGVVAVVAAGLHVASDA